MTVSRPAWEVGAVEARPAALAEGSVLNPHWPASLSFKLADHSPGLLLRKLSEATTMGTCRSYYGFPNIITSTKFLNPKPYVILQYSHLT